MGDALEKFLLLEKQTRQAEDSFSSGKVLVAIVEMLFEKGEYKTLMEYIVLLLVVKLVGVIFGECKVVELVIYLMC